MPSVPAEPEWPPRSPGEALLCTPGGRARLRRLAEQTSPSPSPKPKRRLLAAPPHALPLLGDLRQDGNGRAANGMADGVEERDEDECPAGLEDEGCDDDDVGGDQNEDDDEDEETLQLKLQEIQALLRLKRLKKARMQKSQVLGATLAISTATTATGSASTHTPAQATATAAAPARSRSPGRTADVGLQSPIRRPLNATGLAPKVEVPASPVHQPSATKAGQSPRRVILGIDKGLKAQDVSLKRAPGLRRSPLDRGAPSTHAQPPPHTSFNERLAQARKQEAARHEARERAQAARTSSFDIDQRDLVAYKQNAADIPYAPEPPRQFSRDEVLNQERPADAAAAAQPLAPEPATKASEAGFDPYSSLHLSRRIMPHLDLARHLSGKKVMLLPDLLREVRAPDFSLPDVEQDIVVLAIWAKKSDPRSHKQQPASSTGTPGSDSGAVTGSGTGTGNLHTARGKYMVVTLVDLQHEIDLYLFDSGFDRYWSLSEGTVIALLNPSVMAPQAGRADTGRFGLIVNSEVDVLLEIGLARDLAWCKSIRRDGAPCPNWVNARRTEHCEFHANAAISRLASTRVELSAAGFGGGARRSRGGGGADRRRPGRSAAALHFDRETGTRWFATRPPSAAELLDGADGSDGLAGRRLREQALRRRLTVMEREREMAKKLSTGGAGAGREYMTAAATAGTTVAATSAGSRLSNSLDPPPLPRDARSLGLVAPRAVQLSPVKRKRTESPALGWGGELSDRLGRIRAGQTLRTPTAVAAAAADSARKKTRFVTDRGIREAGRESLGADRESPRRCHKLDDDDDGELVILR